MPAPSLRPRGVEWEPGLLSVQPGGLAARLAAAGASTGEIRTAISATFPELTAQHVGQLAAQAQRVAPVLAGFERAFDWQTLPRESIPRNNALSNAYRYIVRANFESAETNQQSSVTVVLDENHNLTRGELDARVSRVGASVRDQYQGLIELEGGAAVTDWRLRDIDIIQVERRT